MTDSGRELDIEAITQEVEDLQGVEPVEQVHVLPVREVTWDGVMEVRDVDEVGKGRDDFHQPVVERFADDSEERVGVDVVEMEEEGEEDVMDEVVSVPKGPARCEQYVMKEH
jgi:hypothetical protein